MTCSRARNAVKGRQAVVIRRRYLVLEGTCIGGAAEH
jgi:hypothetical protein